MRALLIVSWMSGCNTLGLGEGCLERDLDLWCTQGNDGPTTRDEDCDEPSGSPSYRCGEYDVVEQSNGLSGVTHYFDADGKHVATSYFKDVNTWCGDFVYWYGRRIHCEPECTYDESHGLPSCSDD